MMGYTINLSTCTEGEWQAFLSLVERETRSLARKGIDPWRGGPTGAHMPDTNSPPESVWWEWVHRWAVQR